MKAPTSYRLAYRRRSPLPGAGPLGIYAPRLQRIVDSLRAEIAGGGPGHELRIRRVFQNPREIFRLELELPEMSYSRTTLLDRDALEELLESEDVREAVHRALGSVTTGARF